MSVDSTDFPSVAEIKEYTGISTEVSDDIVEMYIDTAIEFVEVYTGTLFGKVKEIEELFDGTASNIIQLKYFPINSIVYVSYSLDFGNSYIILPSNYYSLRTFGLKLSPLSFVRQTKMYNQIKVRYIYGYETIPLLVRECVKELAGAYVLGQKLDKNSYLDSVKLGDATIYKKDVVKKKEQVEMKVKELLKPYVIDSSYLVR